MTRLTKPSHVVGLGDKRPASTGLDDDPKPPTKRRRPSDPYASQRRTASDLYANAWGKRWPQSQGMISKTEISGDQTGLVNDDDDVDEDDDDDDDEDDVDNDDDVDDDDEVDGALANNLKVPPEFEYRYLEDIRTLKSALGANPGEDEEDFLVVRKEYEILREGLEDESKYERAIVMTGHPGIGSYETWF